MALNGLAAGQQALMSPMAQQGAPLIMNPPMANPGFNPYVLMQQGEQAQCVYGSVCK